MSNQERMVQKKDFDTITFGKNWKIVALPTQVSALCFDLEKTLVTDTDWIKHIRNAEIDILSEHLNWPNPRNDFESMRLSMANQLGRKKVSVSYMANQLGIETRKWNEYKEENFHPEKFDFQEKNVVVPMLTALLQKSRAKVGIMTNTPAGIVEKILRKMDLEEKLINQISFFTADNIGVPKPKSPFFETMVSDFSLPTKEIIIIGDDPHKDLKKPIEIGMGAAFVQNHEQAVEVLNFLYSKNLFTIDK